MAAPPCRVLQPSLVLPETSVRYPRVLPVWCPCHPPVAELRTQPSPWHALLYSCLPAVLPPLPCPPLPAIPVTLLPRIVSLAPGLAPGLAPDKSETRAGARAEARAGQEGHIAAQLKNLLGQ